MAAELPIQWIREALLHHPSVRVQRELQVSAQASVEGAKWQYWPTPSVGYEFANTADPTFRGDSSVTTLRLQQPLWTGGRLAGNLSRAEANAIVAQADSEIIRQQISFRVVQAWSEAIAAKRKLEAYSQSRELHSRLLGLVERRTADGVSAQADIELAHSRLESTEAELTGVHAQLDTALEKIRRLLGRAPDASEVGDLSGGKMPRQIAPMEILMKASKELSPQVNKARAQVKAAEAEIKVAKSAVSPDIYLRAERQYGNFNFPSQEAQSRVFVGMTTAFGSGLSSATNIDAAVAKFQAAQEEVLNQEVSLEEQLQSDVILLQAAIQRRTSIEQAGRYSVRVSASYERQFQAGRKQWQELMNAAREQAQSDVQLADADAAMQLASWRLIILTQGVDSALAMAPVVGTSDQPRPQPDCARYRTTGVCP